MSLKSQLLFLLFALLAFGLFLPDTGHAFTPRSGFKKVRIGYLFPQPNASAAAQLISETDAELVASYPAALIAYAPDGVVDGMAQRAAALQLEFTVLDDYDRIFLPGARIDARLGTAASLPGKPLSPPYGRFQQGLHVIQFSAPITQAWLAQLRALGATPIQYVANNAYIVSTTPEIAAAIAMLPFVQFVDQLHASIKPQGVRRISGQVDDFYVIVANVPDSKATLSVLASVSRGPPDSSPFGDDQLLVRVSLDGADIERVLAEPLVIGISHVPTVALSDERVATSMTGNIDPISGAPTKPTKYKDWLASACPFCTNLQHDGFYVAMADTGLDGGVNGNHHADLPLARVRYGKNFDLVDQNDPNGTPCGASLPCQDVNGHGTMTAGIVAGNPANGSATDAGGFLFGAGVAPSAGVFFSKVDLRQHLATRVSLLATDARISASPAVYIQNHSYNQYVSVRDQALSSGIYCDPDNQTYDGAYSIMSSLFDRSVKDADQAGTLQPITLTVSSGNQYPFWGLIQCRDVRRTLPAATAKNVISVGAAESVRGPSEQWNCEAGSLPGISANSYNNIMGGSRRGTLNDHWYKPDLMAPGSNVASLRSTVWDGVTNSLCLPAGGGAQPPPFSGGDTYLGGSGTSFAAPAAAGAALLASRVYAEHLLPGCANTSCDPGAASPALLKAMLIMSARSMRGGQDQAVAP